jgi:hypothetical protein
MIAQGVKVPERTHIIAAITAVVKDFQNRARERDSIFALPPHIATLEREYRDEQLDLAIAIVYAWIRKEWELFAERFQVLAFELDTQFINRIGNLTIIWESKADGIIRERKPPFQIRVVSWKSAADTSEWTRRRYRSDLQGFLETYFAELHTGLTIDFNQVIYLVKGKKLRIGTNGVELPWNADIADIVRYASDSFLLTPLIKPEDARPPFFNELENVHPNIIWTPSYRQEGNISDSMFRGWTRAERFKRTDTDTDQWPLLFNWIDDLHSGHVFPTPSFLAQNSPGPLERVIVWENPSARNSNLTQELIREITFHTHHLMTTLDPPNGFNDPEVIFSRNLKACYEGPPDAQGRIGCPFVDICRGPAAMSPGAEGLDYRVDDPPYGFIWRTPHHAGEAANATHGETRDKK